MRQAKLRWRRWFPIVLASLLSSGGEAQTRRGSAEDPYEWFFLIPAPLSDISRREMIDSAAAWSDHLRASGLGTFRATFFDTLLDVDAFIRRRIAEGRPPTFAIIDNMVAVRMKEEWRIRPILCPVYEGKDTVASVVVVPRANTDKTIADLRGGRIAVVKMLAEAPDLLGLTIFGEAVSPLSFFAEVVATQTQRDCLIALARRNADAALVNKPFFEAAQRRDRDAWKEFKVLAELPEQHMAAFVVFGDTPAETAEALKVLVQNAKDSDAGRHILDLHHVDGFRPCGIDSFRAEIDLIAKLDARAARTSAPEPPEAPADIAPPASMEVRRHGDTGAVSAVVRFGKSAPAGLKVIVRLDDGPEEALALPCRAGVCEVTLPASRVSGKSRLSVLVVMEKDGKIWRLGQRKSYPL